MRLVRSRATTLIPARPPQRVEGACFPQSQRSMDNRQGVTMAYISATENKASMHLILSWLSTTETSEFQARARTGPRILLYFFAERPIDIYTYMRI